MERRKKKKQQQKTSKNRIHSNVHIMCCYVDGEVIYVESYLYKRTSNMHLFAVEIVVADQSLRMKMNRLIRFYQLQCIAVVLQLHFNQSISLSVSS